jgi:hypothetical protein
MLNGSKTMKIIHRTDFTGTMVCKLAQISPEINLSVGGKGNKGITLPTSEAKYVSMSEAVKEIMLVYYALMNLGSQSIYPSL